MASCKTNYHIQNVQLNLKVNKKTPQILSPLVIANLRMSSRVCSSSCGQDDTHRASDLILLSTRSILQGSMKNTNLQGSNEDIKMPALFISLNLQWLRMQQSSNTALKLCVSYSQHLQPLSHNSNIFSKTNNSLIKSLSGYKA